MALFLDPFLRRIIPPLIPQDTTHFTRIATQNTPGQHQSTCRGSAKKPAKRRKNTTLSKSARQDRALVRAPPQFESWAFDGNVETSAQLAFSKFRALNFSHSGVRDVIYAPRARAIHAPGWWTSRRSSAAARPESVAFFGIPIAENWFYKVWLFRFPP